MTKFVLIATCVLATWLTLSVTAADARVRCKFLDTRWPGVTELAASNAGCTSAWGVADAIKDGWAADEKGETNPYMKAVCVSGRRTVGMVLA
jgi:hypothetical protein